MCPMGSASPGSLRELDLGRAWVTRGEHLVKNTVDPLEHEYRGRHVFAQAVEVNGPWTLCNVTLPWR